MKIILNQEIEIAGKLYVKGQQAEAPESIVASLIAHGYARAAEAVEQSPAPAPAIETADLPPAAEKATRRRK